MIRIRRAESADASALTVLVLASSAYAGVYASMLDGYEITAAQIARDEIHVAHGESIQGFYSLLTGSVPELDLMFVRDAAQGEGIGRMLFDHMRALAQKIGVRSVKIVAHPPAAGFYRSMGAVEVGIAFPMGATTWPRPIFSLSIATPPSP